MKELSALRRDLKKYIETADEKTIKMIYAMLEVDQDGDWWEHLSDEARLSIEKGLKDADAGKVTPNAVVMEKYRQWLSK